MNHASCSLPTPQPAPQRPCSSSPPPTLSMRPTRSSPPSSSGSPPLSSSRPLRPPPPPTATSSSGRRSPMGPLVGALGRWIYGAVKPPSPPRICGTPGSPPVTAPRVRLRDRRHLAYVESGVRKEDTRFKVVFSHGFTGSRLDTVHTFRCSVPPMTSETD